MYLTGLLPPVARLVGPGRVVTCTIFHSIDNEMLILPFSVGSVDASTLAEIGQRGLVLW